MSYLLMLADKSEYTQYVKKKEKREGFSLFTIKYADQLLIVLILQSQMF